MHKMYGRPPCKLNVNYVNKIQLKKYMVLRSGPLPTGKRY